LAKTGIRGRGWAAGVLCAAACLAACYTYSAPLEVSPEPGRTFAFEVTDLGRAALAAGMGSGTDRIEGVLVGLTDTAYSVSVARVVDIRGRVARWSGEDVSLRREFIDEVRQRRRSPARTAIAIGGISAAVAALATYVALDVVGNDPDRTPGEEPPPGQESRHFPFTLHRSR
jgi:hypothetical protein